MHVVVAADAVGAPIAFRIYLSAIHAALDEAVAQAANIAGLAQCEGLAVARWQREAGKRRK